MVISQSKLMQRAQAIQPTFSDACDVVEVQLPAMVNQMFQNTRIGWTLQNVELLFSHTYRVLMFFNPQNAPSSNVWMELRRNFRTLRPSKP
jgi:hypothetical protein